MTIRNFLKSEKIKISETDRGLFGSMVAIRAKKDNIVPDKDLEILWGGKLTIDVNDYPDTFIPVIKEVYRQFEFLKNYQLEHNTS